MNWDKQILQFYRQLGVPQVPAPYEVLFPFGRQDVWESLEAFYAKYYEDTTTRHVMIGINPGRMGAGVTGLPFTDPIRLKDACGVQNTWPRKPELSSIFMYEMIEAFGGVSKFFAKFYVTAACPVGFEADGKNVNYYDDRKLSNAIEEFAVNAMQEQMQWNINKDVCFCVGEGKNLQFLQRLNQQHGWFKTIVPLAHPRFVMQYKRTQIDSYIQKYLDAFHQHGVV
ncbi:MAG TPA: uracil-DNA glycosylase family protein [Phnomibacter sp.]|nr:uracil-DNA glycosylase family protein [Phnomibacter sp.]